MNPVRNHQKPNMDPPPLPPDSLNDSYLAHPGADEYSPIDQNYDGDLESPNDMMVDPDDFVTEQPENEKNDVAIINPDLLGNDVDMVDKPRADNCASTSLTPCIIWTMP
jgi:hypothetical protein